MDLFSQAEHDEIAQAILIATSQDYLDEVQAAMHRLMPTMPRRTIIEASLGNRGAMILAKDLDEACAIANYIAPEHLELSVENAAEWAKKSATQALSLWDATPAKVWVTTAPAPTMCCPPAARAVLLALGHV